MKVVLRAGLVLVCLAMIGAILFVCLTRAQEAPLPPAATFQITGTVKNGKTVLSGVTVTASNTLTGKKWSVATAVDGSFTLKNLPRGRYVVKVEFMGFAPQTQEIVLNPQNPTGKVDTELVLASRQAEQTEQANSATARNRGFQNLAVDNSLQNPGPGGYGSTPSVGNVSVSDLSSLPMNGAGSDLATESVAVTGTVGRTQDFGNGNEDELQQRMQEFRDRAQREAGGFGATPGAPPGGGPGGAPGGFSGGGGPIAFGRMGRGFDINKPHGFLYVQDDNAGLDAQSYSLSGQQAQKASYNSLHFGAFVGGPLKIPKIFDGGKTTFYSVGWNGTRGSTPYDSFSTVPQADNRSSTNHRREIPL